MKTVSNIIIVNDNASVRGGADAVAISTAVGLSESGYHVIFFAATLPVDKDLENAGVEVICLGIQDILHDSNRFRAIKNGIYNKSSEIEFEKLLSNYSPGNTIVHIHTWTKALSSSIFKTAESLGYKIVLTLHDFFSVCPNGGFYNYNRKTICHLRPLSLKCICANCDSRSYLQKQWRVIRQIFQNNEIEKVSNLCLIAVSRKVAEEVEKYLPNKHALLEYLHNPIEVLKSEPIPIEHNDKYLFMGRLAKEKGPDLFCEAITQMGLKGIVVGDGYMRQQLEDKYPNVEFVGWLSGNEKLKVIKECKCSVFTSRWYETFGLVVAEMQALGVPSIVPEESAAAEQIENHKNGLLYTSGDIVSLKDAIEKFEHMDIREIQKHVLSSFKADLFSLKTHVENLLSIYEKFMCD